MKKTFLLLGILLLQYTIYSQNSVWSLAPNYLNTAQTILEPTALPQPAIPPGQSDFYYYHGQPAEHSHNAMQDENGDLLFFIVDDMVYDKDGYFD